LWISACFRWSTCWFFVFIKRNAENVIKSGILAEMTWKYTSESVTWSTYILLLPQICWHQEFAMSTMWWNLLLVCLKWHESLRILQAKDFHRPP
jgi:hypothetical protein